MTTDVIQPPSTRWLPLELLDYQSEQGSLEPAADRMRLIPDEIEPNSVFIIPLYDGLALRPEDTQTLQVRVTRTKTFGLPKYAPGVLPPGYWEVSIHEWPWLAPIKVESLRAGLWCLMHVVRA